MPRGGFRKNAGRKGGWKNAETKTIRVPAVFADLLLEIAKKLDSGESMDFVTKSKFESNELVPESKLKIDSVTNSNNEWLTTREAWEQLEKPKPWNTFRKMKIDALKRLYGLDADSSRRVQGKTDAKWLRFLPDHIL